MCDLACRDPILRASPRRDSPDSETAKPTAFDRRSGESRDAGELAPAVGHPQSASMRTEASSCTPFCDGHCAAASRKLDQRHDEDRSSELEAKFSPTAMRMSRPAAGDGCPASSALSCCGAMGWIIITSASRHLKRLETGKGASRFPSRLRRAGLRGCRRKCRGWRSGSRSRSRRSRRRARSRSG
jgi:hypothetical protein